MKINVFIFLGIWIFLFMSCNTHNVRQKKEKPQPADRPLYIKLHTKIYQTTLLDSLTKNNKNLKNLVQNFKDSIYSIELLKDKTKQNMSYIRPLTLMRRQSILDTPAVKSRLILTNMHIKKLNYLINKKTLDKDSIEKTLNRIVFDLNNVLLIAQKYNHNKDEFLEILQYDSIMHDSLKLLDTAKLEKNKKILITN